jgi:Uma2 family endonuclease
MAMIAVAEALMTAEEFEQLPDTDARRELVRGRLVVTPPTGFEHGTIQMQLGGLMNPYLRHHNLGRLASEVGAILARNPDTVRGPDAVYYSFTRIPANSRPRGFPRVLPELVVEIVSPEDTWPEVMTKVGEYLAAGIHVVVIDPVPQVVHVFELHQPPRQVGPADIFDFPALWPGLAFPVADLFV